MSVSAAHAAVFRHEVATDRQVWTVLEDGSYVAPHKPRGVGTAHASPVAL
jgi:hypothetical protein